MEIHSLTYDEFLVFNKLQASDIPLKGLLRNGGLPFLANLPQDDVVAREYLAVVLDYLDYLTRSFAVIRCPTMDIVGKIVENAGFGGGAETFIKVSFTQRTSRQGSSARIRREARRRGQAGRRPR